MSGEITITPGKAFGASEKVNRSKLNQLGQPTARANAASVGARELVVADLVQLLQGYFSNRNFLINGNFYWTLWASAGPTSCAAGQKTLLAPPWWVKPAGSAVTQERSTDVPNTKSYNSLKVTGAASVTTVDIGQNVARDFALGLRQSFTVSFYIYNGSGAAFTPSLVLNKANAADDFSAVTNVLNQALTSVPNATWTQLTTTVDGSVLAGLENGFEFSLRIPSGSMDNPAKSVELAQLKLELGSSATPFVNGTDFAVLAALVGDGTLSTAKLASQAALSVLGNAGLSSGPLTALTGSALAALFRLPSVADGRLTLSSGTPVPTVDVTGATTVYYTPHSGSGLSLYDGTNWGVTTFTELSLGLTQAITGTTANTSAVVTGLTDTSGLVAGMVVTGTGIATNPDATRVVSVDSLTQVTLSQAATASGTVSLTFALPKHRCADVFVYGNNAILSGTLTSGAATVTGISSTANLTIGMTVTGTGVPGGTKILQVNSGTQVTLTANATASGTMSLTFAAAARLEFSLWTAPAGGQITGVTAATPPVVTSASHGLSADMLVTTENLGGISGATGTFRVGTVTTNTFQLLNLDGTNPTSTGTYTASTGQWVRADQTGIAAPTLGNQDGVTVKNGATTRRYLGVLCITKTPGQCEFSTSRRLLSNAGNKSIFYMKALETAASYSYASSTTRAANNNLTLGTARIEYLCGSDGDVTLARHFGLVENKNSVDGYGIGVDSITANSAQLLANNTSGGTMVCATSYHGYPGRGYHFTQVLDMQTGGTAVVRSGFSGGIRFQTGLIQEVRL